MKKFRTAKTFPGFGCLMIRRQRGARRNGQKTRPRTAGPGKDPDASCGSFEIGKGVFGFLQGTDADFQEYQGETSESPAGT